MRNAILFCAFAGLALSAPSGARAEDLYEWMAVAPIVATVTISAEDDRLTEVSVGDVLRGDLRPGASILVDLRRANRERRQGVKRLDLPLGNAYLVLLEPSTPRKPAPLPVYALVRGPSGARPLPEEGREAVVAAARRLATIQTIADDRLVWGALGDLLFEPSPRLIEVSLDLHLKFGRGGESLLPRLDPLLDHPSPGIRERSCRLVGEIVSRSPARSQEVLAPERLRVLIGKARGDPAVPVRIAATRALAAYRTATSLEALRSIADNDPVQDVRYEAERLLHDSSISSD